MFHKKRGQQKPKLHAVVSPKVKRVHPKPAGITELVPGNYCCSSTSPPRHCVCHGRQPPSHLPGYRCLETSHGARHRSHDDQPHLSPTAVPTALALPPPPAPLSRAVSPAVALAGSPVPEQQNKFTQILNIDLQQTNKKFRDDLLLILMPTPP